MGGFYLESVLNTIKKLSGIGVEYDHYNTDMIICINTALFNLNQLGVGENLMITGPDETWSSLIGARVDIEAIKTYVSLKTRLLFDPPTSSFVIGAMERQLKELEWRINVTVDKGGVNNG